MINKKIEAALNKQIEAEANSSNLYLAMASWAEAQGYEGVSNFFYDQSDEERQHMLKLVKYVNERGGRAHICATTEPLKIFDCLTHVFQDFLDHEVEITKENTIIIDGCLKEKDYTTHNFMQWFVSEQIEEEALARNIMDKIELIGNDKGGLYLFDRDLEKLSSVTDNDSSEK